MGKRIRHPKKEKKEKKEQKQEQKEQETQKQHFTLDVHNSTVSGISGFGQ